MECQSTLTRVRFVRDRLIGICFNVFLCTRHAKYRMFCSIVLNSCLDAGVDVKLHVFCISRMTLLTKYNEALNLST